MRSKKGNCSKSQKGLPDPRPSYLRESVDKVKGALYKYLSEHSEITAAIFRGLLGSSRKYTIALLEYFDREGITVRIGDARRLKSPMPARR